jgi:predicted transcriptional regulator
MKTKTQKKRLIKHKKITDGIKILDELVIKQRPEIVQMMEEERVNAKIARQIYQLRTKAKLTQLELARRVGTTASVISRLEDADYEGHSVSMLHRIAEALHQRVQVRFVKAK